MTFKGLAKGEPCSLLDVMVVKILDGGKALVAENAKSAAILLHDEKLKEGQGLKLIKPLVEGKDPLVLKQNPLFKIQRGSTKDIKMKDDVMVALTDKASKMKQSAGGEGGPTLEEVDNMKLGQDLLIPTDVFVVLCTVSRVCKGQFGNYQISNIKDRANKKGTMAIYGHLVTLWCKMANKERIPLPHWFFFLPDKGGGGRYFQSKNSYCRFADVLNRLVDENFWTEK